MEIDISSSIFPLVTSPRTPVGKSVKPRFLGTCFLTELAGFPVVVTAKHVVEMANRETEFLHIIRPFVEQATITLEQSIVVSHVTLDIAFIIMNLDVYEANKSVLRTIPISDQVLPLGANVSTFGYPNTNVVLDEATGDHILQIDNFVMKGYVTNVMRDSSVTGVDKAYILSFPAMPGISGAPLLYESAGGISCVGFLLRNMTSTQFVAERSENIDGLERIIHVYRTIDFGIACDAKALLEAESQLRNPPGKSPH